MAASVPVLIDSNGQMGTVLSSIRYKENIADIGDISSSLLKLRPVIFDYISNKESSYGFIAEEVNEVMPELVIRDKSGEIMTVNYSHIPVLLLNEFKKLIERIEDLEKKFNN